MLDRDRSQTITFTPTAPACGCPRCGSMCARLDDCSVCRGEAPCARCLFGLRAEDGEVHTRLVLEA